MDDGDLTVFPAAAAGTFFNFQKCSSSPFVMENIPVLTSLAAAVVPGVDQ